MPNFKVRDRTYTNRKEKMARISGTYDGAQEQLVQIPADFWPFEFQPEIQCHYFTFELTELKVIFQSKFT